MRIIEGQGLDATGSRRGVRLGLAEGRLVEVTPVQRDVESDTLVMPALVNAHDHARPVRTSSVGGFAKPLEIWLHRLALLVPVDPYLATLAALGRQVLGGQGATMLHAVRLMGLTDVVTEARQVARAAQDVGIRLAFGLGMRTRTLSSITGRRRCSQRCPPAARQEIEGRFCGPMLPIAQQMANFQAVVEAIQGSMVDVQYAPNGPQWVSEPLLADHCRSLGPERPSRHHASVRDTIQREWADRTYPQGLVRHWKDIGLLSAAPYAGPLHLCPADELEMIAEAGCTISVNTSSNLALRSVSPLLARWSRQVARWPMASMDRPLTRMMMPSGNPPALVPAWRLGF